MAISLDRPTASDGQPDTPSKAQAQAPANTGDPLSSGAQPTALSDRLESLDILRGVAILGILILNIPIMAMPFSVYQNPAVFGDPSPSTLISWYVTMFAFEGTFRAIFGMLFGAGVYLFLSRAEDRYGTTFAVSLHLRRMVILIIIGAVDAFVLLWVGDILMAYGTIGLILWLFRRSGFKTLTVWMIIFVLISGGLKIGHAASVQANIADIDALDARLAAGENLSDSDIARRQMLADDLAMDLPTKEIYEGELDSYRNGYSHAFVTLAPVTFMFQTVIFALFGLWDSLIVMLLGIMLLRSGFLKNTLSTRTYGLTAVLGYGVAVPMRYLTLDAFMASDFDITVLLWWNTGYDVMRIFLALGHVSLLLLILRAGRLPIRGRLAAAGRMALTNYVMQSGFALVIFLFAGWYGYLSRAETYIVMAAIWVFQLWFSPRYLARHRQGPVETLWRRLTYGRQPRRETA